MAGIANVNVRPQRDDYPPKYCVFWCMIVDGELVFRWSLLARNGRGKLYHSKQRNCILSSRQFVGQFFSLEKNALNAGNLPECRSNNKRRRLDCEKCRLYDEIMVNKIYSDFGSDLIIFKYRFDVTFFIFRIRCETFLM